MIINNKYKILTPTGFQEFAGLQCLNKNVYLELLLSTGKIVKCSLSHKFICNSEEIQAQHLKVNDYIDSNFAKVSVVDIKHVKENIKLYDILEVNNGNLFCVDDIISHNCDVSFLSSGQTIVEPEVLSWYEENLIKEPIQKRGIGDDLWIWKFPDYSKTYILVADVARGDGSDSSAFHILDIETLEQVAEYVGKIDTTTYGRMLVSMAIEYNNALLVIENTGIGYATVQVALDLGYKNLHYSYKNDPFLDENIHLSKNIDLKMNKDKIPGFTTSHILRPMLVSKIDMYFREKSPIIYSRRTIGELRVFIWKNGRGEAQQGYHDDLVMALGMGLFLRDTALKLRQIGIELTKRTLESTHKTVYKPTTKAASPWNVPNARGGTTDLTWLL